MVEMMANLESNINRKNRVMRREIISLINNLTKLSNETNKSLETMSLNSPSYEQIKKYIDDKHSESMQKIDKLEKEVEKITKIRNPNSNHRINTLTIDPFLTQIGNFTGISTQTFDAWSSKYKDYVSAVGN